MKLKALISFLTFVSLKAQTLPDEITAIGFCKKVEKAFVSRETEDVFYKHLTQTGLPLTDNEFQLMFNQDIIQVEMILLYSDDRAMVSKNVNIIYPVISSDHFQSRTITVGASYLFKGKLLEKTEFRTEGFEEGKFYYVPIYGIDSIKYPYSNFHLNDADSLERKRIDSLCQNLKNDSLSYESWGIFSKLSDQAVIKAPFRKTK